MTLRPIPGAPADAPVPDFPTGEPSPLVAPESGATRRPVEPLQVSLPPTGRRPGPIAIRGGGDSTLVFQVIPEVPAINRSSMIISITGEPSEDYSARMMPHFDLATDEARAFLLALRDGASPIVIAHSRTALRLEFVVAEDGPAFVVSKPGQGHTARRFDVGQSYDVRAMAAHLLAELGP